MSLNAMGWQYVNQAQHDPVCFWSYTHRDNQLEGGRIVRLADAIANEYEILTGDRLRIFVDKSAIEWGDEWKAVINAALGRTAFFVPVVTPNYLRSEECRREFVEFAGRVRSIDAMDLLLPILYTETAAVADEATQDEVARLVRQTQYLDWRQLRLADEASEQYRKSVHELAQRLVSLFESMADGAPQALEEIDEDKPGMLDKLAQAEESASSWAGHLTDLSSAVSELGAIATNSTEKLHDSDRRGGGARGRLVVFRQFSEELREPAERIGALGSRFGQSVVDADPGVQALIRAAKLEGDDAEDDDRIPQFFQSVRGLADAANQSSGQLRTFVGQLDTIESLSRLGRAPIRQVKGGLSAFLDAVTVLNRWADLVDADINE